MEDRRDRQVIIRTTRFVPDWLTFTYFASLNFLVAQRLDRARVGRGAPRRGAAPRASAPRLKRAPRASAPRAPRAVSGPCCPGKRSVPVCKPEMDLADEASTRRHALLATPLLLPRNAQLHQAAASSWTQVTVRVSLLVARCCRRVSCRAGCHAHHERALQDEFLLGLLLHVARLLL